MVTRTYISIQTQKQASEVILSQYLTLLLALEIENYLPLYVNKIEVP